jgi:SAM-dependent methyltransferase
VNPKYFEGRSVPRGVVQFYFDCLGTVERVLDLGCGVGDVGAFRPQSRVRVVGLDNDLAALRLAARHETVILSDLEEGALPFADDSFDAIIAKDVLEHLLMPELIVQEICRILRPGGTMLASVPMAKPRRVWDDYTHIRGFTRRAIRALLEDAGFAVERVLRMGGIPLAGRLNAVRLIPVLLMIPPMNALFGSSFMVLASKPERVDPSSRR